MKTITIVKDLIISILIIVCIFIILAVIFYDKISISKIIPESQEYLLTEEMQKGIDDENLQQVEEVITEYYIDATDLKKYEKTNEYNKGKKNPFALESTGTDNSINKNNSNNDSNTLSKNESENFYEDDGTK